MKKVAKNELINNYRALNFKNKSLFKKNLIEKTGWSESTFQYKMRNSNLNKLELEVASQVLTEIEA